MAEKTKVDLERTKAMQERNKERNLMIQEMKNRGSLTVDELSQATGIEKARILKHLIAMRQFGKVQIAGERSNQFAYALQKETPKTK